MTARFLCAALLAGCSATHVGNPEDAPVRPWESCDELFSGAERGCAGRAPTTRDVTASDDLERAVATACPGDTIHVAAGRFEGRFRVGPGVTLAGDGADQTVLSGGSGAVVCAAGGATIEALSVESDGVALAGSGAGALTVRDVEIRPARSFGIVTASLGTARLERVRVAGASTRDAAAALTGSLEADRAVMAGILIKALLTYSWVAAGPCRRWRPTRAGSRTTCGACSPLRHGDQGRGGEGHGLEREKGASLLALARRDPAHRCVEHPRKCQETP